jgi:hypothetical protein
MPLWCAGCGKPFASIEAFALHATGITRPAADCPRRCRTTVEMHALGMGRIGQPMLGASIATGRKRGQSMQTEPSDLPQPDPVSPALSQPPDDDEDDEDEDSAA